MLISLAALFALAAPAAAPASPPPVATAITGGCFGPCHVPGCPNSTFWVCHGTTGKTKVYAESGGASVRSTQSNTSTFSIGVLGATVHPAAPGNWGSVSSCGDIHGDC